MNCWTSVRIDRHVGALAELGRPVALGVEDVGVDQARADDRRRQAGAHLAQVPVDALGEADDAVLGDVVGVGGGGQPGDRGRVDDVALVATFEHAGDERPHAVDDAHQVDAHRPVPVGERPLPGPQAQRGRGGGDAGVVEDHVDPPERAERGVGQAVDGLGRRHVGRHGEHLDAGGLDRRLRRGQRVGLDVGEHEVHALGGEAVGGGQPDPARRAGHDGHPILDVLHWSTPFVPAGRYVTRSARPGGRRRRAGGGTR